MCNESGDDCDGGNAYSCYDVWTSYGAVASSCMPYTGNDNAPCTQDECEVKARLHGYSYVMYGETYLKTALLTQPIAVSIYVTGPFSNYHSGCYSGPNGGTNHMVLLCGWDDNICGTGREPG